MHETLWRRVEAALDARLDPSRDAELAAALAADPGADRAVRRLTARLALLGGAPSVRAPRGRARRVAAVAAALFLVASAALFLRTGERAAGPTAAMAARPAERIQTVSLVVERTSPPPARHARVVLESRRVQGWTLEGAAPR